jgi:hypothetical protein
VTVWPVPPKPSARLADQVSTRPLGSMAAAAGTSGKVIGALHRPMTGPVCGPRTLISAALVHWPRAPASVSPVSRTYRACVPVKVAVFAALVSAQVPVAAGVPQVVPSVLSSMRYWPMRPLDEVSCRGR